VGFPGRYSLTHSNACVNLRGDYRHQRCEIRRKLLRNPRDSSRYVTRTMKRSRDERRAKLSGVSKRKRTSPLIRGRQRQQY
jgi:hypothetical protein